ncbi:MAG: queuosine salvage family protein [Myxococcota bacterium]|nr:queuosine salvage family protein [Myxococcota bacterium]
MTTPDVAEPGEDIFEEIRTVCAEVTRRARHVRIDDTALEAFAAHLGAERPSVRSLDPTHAPFKHQATTVAFVLTMNAINFGSGWFPQLRKRKGLSGYRSLASALREHFERNGLIRAEALKELEAADCARLFGQEGVEPVEELMALYARALRDLGELVSSDHAGRFEGVVEAAEHRASKLVRILWRMPLYRDVASYQELQVPFYKRAQITCADLSEALGGKGLGHFEDVGELTLFADNLVPHVMRMLGILVYDGRLLARVQMERLIEWGCEEEVEIRAVALTALERLAASAARRGYAPGIHRLDALLWTRGQHPQIKSQPRHRTRCSYY